MMTEKQIESIEEIAKEIGMSSKRFLLLQQGLKENEDIEKELFTYLEKEQFLCEVKVAGYSFVDVLIWQIDHFRAYLDRDTTLTRRNPKAMGLLAAETMLSLRKDPTKFIAEYTTQTGTDQ